MNIWLVTVGEEIPSDPGSPRLLRTGILARHLTARGHRVTWWNSTVNHQQKIQRADQTTVNDTPEGYRLILLHGQFYTHNTSLTRFLNHRDLAHSFARTTPTQLPPDAIVCSYPPIELADQVVAYANQSAIPVIVDFRDMWPDAIAAHLPLPVRLAATPFIASWRTALTRIVRRSTSIIGITESFVDWALRAGNRTRSDLDRAFHLTVDTQPPSTDQRAAAETFWDRKHLGRNTGFITGCFLGSISHRDDLLAVILASLDLPEDDRDRLRLVYCGPEDLMQDIERAAPDAEHIIRAGWRNAAEIYTLLRRANFGMLPYPSTPDFKMSLPNKVGEYLSAGLPIMTGLEGETRKLLETSGIGLFYQANDTASIRTCLRYMLAEPDRLTALQPAALDIYQDKFDAATIYGEYADYVEALASTRSAD